MYVIGSRVGRSRTSCCGSVVGACADASPQLSRIRPIPLEWSLERALLMWAGRRSSSRSGIPLDRSDLGAMNPQSVCLRQVCLLRVGESHAARCRSYFFVPDVLEEEEERRLCNTGSVLWVVMRR